MSASVARKSPMGLHSSRRPVSSDRDRSSPPRRRERSPIVSSRHSRGSPHEERSPARHKSSYRDRDRPVPATRERHSGRVKSPKRESRSPISRSLSPRSKKLRRAQAEKDVDSASESDHERNHGKGSNKPKHEKSYTDREKLYRDRDEPAPAPRERYSGRMKSPKRESRSPVSRSLSPRSKRLRRAQAEKEFDTASGRDHERNHGKGSDKAKHEKSYIDRDSEKEVPKERRERRSERESERTRDSDRERTRDKEIEKGRDRDAVDRSSSRSKHRRSESPSDRLHNRSRHRSRSPPQALRSRVPVEADDPRGAEHGDDESDALAQMKAAEQALETKEKQKPSFELSGKLAEETNRVRGITLLFTEPPDARKPDVRWRLYVFKGGEVLNEPLYVHRQSCYLFGRERRVADIPTDHPSCSKQHAVLQYRHVEIERSDGMMSKQIKPYLMDLGSTNKTFINDSPIEPQRYYELFEKDTIKFGNSSREYVLLHENSMN